MDKRVKYYMDRYRMGSIMCFLVVFYRAYRDVKLYLMGFALPWKVGYLGATSGVGG